jgi:transcriptional regulator with XRE-family HTH domain
MHHDRHLGEFLRARRQVTSADQVGLRVGRRQTPGLRREEVAMLAGVSADYYTRLEQGKERRPSDQVLDALARVFRLDTEATEHLHELARPRARKPMHVGRVDQPNPHLLTLMEKWDHGPAFAVNRRLDILAKNQQAVALFEGLGFPDNLIRQAFLDPAGREFYVDWEQDALHKAAHLRAAAGADLNDPSLLELVEELSLGSEEFRRMWARHDVQTWACAHESKRLRHSIVGEVTLQLEAFSISRAPGQDLVVCQAEPGSPSGHALAELSDLMAAD